MHSYKLIVRYEDGQKNDTYKIITLMCSTNERAKKVSNRLLALRHKNFEAALLVRVGIGGIVGWGWH